MIAKTKDGKEFSTDGEKERLIGSVPTVRARDVSKPAKVGEFPVCVERFGSYKLFTYNKKIVSVQTDEAPRAMHHMCDDCEASFTTKQLIGGELPPHSFCGKPCGKLAKEALRPRTE